MITRNQRIDEIGDWGGERKRERERERYIYLNGGVTTTVEDLPGLDALDGNHGGDRESL